MYENKMEVKSINNLSKGSVIFREIHSIFIHKYNT